MYKDYENKRTLGFFTHCILHSYRAVELYTSRKMASYLEHSTTLAVSWNRVSTRCRRGETRYLLAMLTHSCTV